MTRRCFALDLKDDAGLIAEYESYHRAVWPEILASIRNSGIRSMEIYRTGNRLFMIMETDASFDAAAKAKNDAADEKVQEWESLMWRYQQALPGALPGQKWMEMKNIFTL